MRRLTPWGRNLATAGGLLVGLGLAIGDFPYLLLGGVLLAASAWHVAAAPRVRLARKLGARAVRAGERLDVQWTVEWSDGPGVVSLHDPVPDPFVLAQGRNLRVLPLDGAGQSVHAYSVRCLARGTHTFKPPEAAAIDPLGAGAADAVPVGDAHEVLVEAAAPRLRRFRVGTSWGAVIIPEGDKARRGGKTNEFRELRPYVQGDPFRSVNWKATARASVDDEDLNLVVNDYEVEGKKTVWVFVDASRRTAGGTNLATTLDRLAEGALTVAQHFLDRGHRVGLTVFGGEHPSVLYPDSGSAQSRRVSLALTIAQPADRDARFGEGVEASKGFLSREKPMLLVFTPLGGDTEGLAQGLAQARALAAVGRHPAPAVVVSPEPTKGKEPVDRLVAVRARAHARGLHLDGVRVVTWDDTRPLAAQLARGVLR
ncbi:MAG TPA: DUF58 domain-containing protein [Candidatus Thermoplasmatota archaeon]|nr:DUF58 domain-containing protein [Candidatus Thermoplasmatota archaeon]